MTQSEKPAHTATNAPSGGVEETAPSLAETDATPAFGPPAEPGEVGTLGPYRVVRQLGAGGMGAVYLATDTRLGRKIALKVMLPRYAANPAAKERFLREARAAAQVSHDNVVTVYEADERGGVPYIAMQLLQGYPLDEYLRKKGGPGLAQILRIARETAAGLAAAHALGLVHRDIKPGNLWLEAPHGRVKVLDFGLAKPVDADVELTRSGAVVGTPAYMSPEQARGQKVDARADLFSLGVVLYRLTTGRLPFHGENTMAVLMALGTEEPTPVRELNPAVPEALEALIHQLLAKDPARRPQTADEVAEAVARLGGDVPQAVPDGGPPVVYVPIQVTAQPEANAFADLDVTAFEPAPEAPAAAPAPVRKRPKPGDRGMWVAAGLAALLAAAVCGGVIIIIKNKDGTETRIEVPDGATVTVKDKGGKTLAQVGPGGKQPAADVDRTAAEWVIALGGTLQVNGDGRDINAVNDLPKEPFRLTTVNLANKSLTDAGLAHLKDCKGLSVLDLVETNVGDAGLAHLKDCPGLTGLILGGTRVTDAGLAHLKDCTSLMGISLSRTRVTDAGLAHLKGCQGLTYLDLFGTQVGDPVVARLKDYKGLTGLNLGGTRVTDAGLAPLKDCKGLTLLNLLGAEVTDAGLTHLKDCKNLTLLNLRGTEVTARGLADFHAAVPGCKVEHDGGAIEPKK
jgi:hypothetical protein